MTAALSVLLLAPEPDVRVYVDALRASHPGLHVASCSAYEDLPASLDAHAPEVALVEKLGAPFPRDALFGAPTLRWVQAGSAGVDHLLPLPDSVVVTSASGIHDEVVADYVVCAALMSNLHFPAFFRQQLARRWQPRELVPARGQTLVVLGLGRIGTLAAAKARALGMRVVGVKARPERRPSGVDAVVGPEALGDVLGEADFLVVTLPLTPSTRGLVNGPLLSMMKRGSVLINVSRGGIVDEDALRAALARGAIGGAVLDVFDQEPLPKESELWGLDNVVITPHTGDARGWRESLAELFSDNVSRYLSGAELRNRVSPERGY